MHGTVPDDSRVESVPIRSFDSIIARLSAQVSQPVVTHWLRRLGTIRRDRRLRREIRRADLIEPGRRGSKHGAGLPAAGRLNGLAPGT